MRVIGRSYGLIYLHYCLLQVVTKLCHRYFCENLHILSLHSAVHCVAVINIVHLKHVRIHVTWLLVCINARGSCQAAQKDGQYLSLCHAWICYIYIYIYLKGRPILKPRCTAILWISCHSNCCVPWNKFVYPIFKCEYDYLYFIFGLNSNECTGCYMNKLSEWFTVHL